jgi:hypothetical protein
MTEPLTRDQVEAGLRVELPVGERRRHVQMLLPTVGDVLPAISAPERREVRDLPYLVLGLIDTIDGEIPGFDDAQEICEAPEALRTLLLARNRLWGDLRMHGWLHARCPHCEVREARLALPTLAFALHTAPPPIFDAHGVFVEVPVLSDPHKLGARPGAVPKTPLLRVTLPTGLLGLSPETHAASLRDIDDDTEGGNALEAEAWRRWAPAGSIPPAGRAHWSYRSAGFRAIVRLTVGLRELGGETALTPERIEELSIADFLFLDAAYFLTHYAGQPTPEALVVTCEACTGRYLPIR